ncbi:hypothetical protein B0H34DRAFT_730073 [Crassisporium funariophilum]|nr:hypothetical protein B0H34DRAFT_730073 [Crassisporium funariophilum]
MMHYQLSMRYLLTLSLVAPAVLGLLVNAAPTPNHVQPGDILKAKPKHFDPRPPGAGSVGQHPVVVLTAPDKHGKVQVVVMSHKHPGNPATRPASSFGLPIDPVKGESTVNVENTFKVHTNRLKGKDAQNMMEPSHLEALKKEILHTSRKHTKKLSSRSLQLKRRQ